MRKERYISVMLIMKKTRIVSFFLTILVFLMISQNSFATTDSTLNGLKKYLSPVGSHRFIYRMFFKLYDARLYTDTEQVISIDELLDGDNALLLEFDYLRKIKKSIILESSEKILSNNMSPTELASIQDRVDRINAAYRTVDESDRSALSYVPGEGTTLWINGQKKVTIEGSDFARLYFRIWLGEQPISKQMRDELLRRVVAEI